MSGYTPSAKAAERGEPSYVWRSGQERRLAMLARRTNLHDCAFLEAGCGNGVYVAKVRERFQAQVEAFDIEAHRVAEARQHVSHAVVARGEALPYPDNTFDVVFSNEVVEHVDDDHQFVAEMVRVLKPGGRLAIFCPNRWYPVEQHGHFWKGEYHFGNTPLINYLPDRWRNKLAPHVRTYTARGIRRLFRDQPVKIQHHSRIFGGYDNIVARYPRLGKWLRRVLYFLEKTPMRFFGLSHWIIVEKRPYNI
ncbi:MAG: class I SAM-dependent methyltransferase [Chloroflexi bacterium]|nr:class I SAM-dependent methyltransferase [Chloroflexota bacterium]